MKKNNYAVYVVGDENIGVGALAALSSFKYYNEGYDLYIYTYVDKLDSLVKEELEKIGTIFCDITPYIDKVEVFGRFHSNELSWPKETFLNYYVPTLLKDDYEYILKLDYDLLTVSEVDLEAIKPKNHQVLSSIHNNFNLYSMVRNQASYYVDNYNIDVDTMQNIGMNTGFLVISTKQFVKQNIFENMTKLFVEISNDDEEIAREIYADQGLLTMYIGFESIPFKVIPEKYNLTVTVLKTVDKLEYTNIHFTGKVKPWRAVEVDHDFIRTFGVAIHACVPIWRDFMREHHKVVYDTLTFETDYAILGSILQFNAMHYRVGAVKSQEAMIIKDKTKKLNSTKYLLKRIVYINLQRIKKKFGGKK